MVCLDWVKKEEMVHFGVYWRKRYSDWENGALIANWMQDRELPNRAFWSIPLRASKRDIKGELMVKHCILAHVLTQCFVSDKEAPIIIITAIIVILVFS